MRPAPATPAAQAAAPVPSRFAAQKFEQRLLLVMPAAYVAVEVAKILHGLVAGDLHDFFARWREVDKKRRGKSIQPHAQLGLGDALAARQGDAPPRFRIDIHQLVMAAVEL